MQNKRSGYTFFELMTVIGVTIIFGSVALLNLPTGLRTKAEIDNAMGNLRSHIALVQQRSINQENGVRWGIHIDSSVPGNHFYQIFYGDSYETGTIVETIYLPDGIIFLSPSNGNTENILFDKVTGRTEDGHSIVIGLESIGENPQLDSANQELQTNLDLIRENAIDQVNNADWGVRADATNPGIYSYDVFYIGPGGGEVVADTITLPDGTLFISPDEGQLSEIIYEKGTGDIIAGDNIVIGSDDYNDTNAGNLVIAPGTGIAERLASVPPFNASMSISPSSGTTQPGGSVQSTVSVNIELGVPELTTFSASNLPTGATATFSPVSCSPTCQSTLTIQTGANTPDGNYAITIYASAGGLFKSTTFNLTVNVPSAPDAPVNLSAVSGSSQIYLAWESPAFTGGSPITNYKVYRGTVSGGEVFSGNAGATLSYVDSGLNNGTTYYYKVSAVNTVGEGSLSSELSDSPTAFNLSGWAWSGNIGWISFNCSNTGICGTSNYGVSADPVSGLMSGYAWSENIGWISFNVSELSGCPSGTCEARITGGLSGSFPKNLSGWAKILSSGDWMRLAGTSQDSSSYGVQVASNKNFSGWSWDPGTIGWLSWSGILYGVSGIW